MPCLHGKILWETHFKNIRKRFTYKKHVFWWFTVKYHHKSSIQNHEISYKIIQFHINVYKIILVRQETPVHFIWDFSEKNEKTRSQRSRKCHGTTAWFLVAFYCKLPKKDENYFFRWFFHDFSEGGRWRWRGLEKLKIMIFFFEASFLHEIPVKSLRGCEKRIYQKILHRYR